ncbi:alpha/beta hydrolase [Roseomonas hellenica]|uniref:Alpha/beta hydrolase n=1 Tax=Plastoroseomonas hellenica TaxID=2687306 RepID=A0ABS5F5L8_9PROT|nr:alpha/beta hydrolase [Plastoroseomonas hellenica]
MEHVTVVEAPANGVAPRLALLLLHGTGGDERDLIPLGREAAPDALLMGLRGRVLEHGAPRFFQRLAEGVFDEADLVARAADLAGFAEDMLARLAPGLPRAALGFSNGANMAAALLLLHPRLLDAAVLLRPMVPLVPATLPDLTGRQVLLSSGMADPIAPPAEGQRLAALMREAGAAVTQVVQPASHGLVQRDVAAATSALREVGRPAAA